jgi:hypothetical protein
MLTLLLLRNCDGEYPIGVDTQEKRQLSKSDKVVSLTQLGAEDILYPSYGQYHGIAVVWWYSGESGCR